jgi:hypothetical protein
MWVVAVCTGPGFALDGETFSCKTHFSKNMNRVQIDRSIPETSVTRVFADNKEAVVTRKAKAVFLLFIGSREKVASIFLLE